LRLIARSVAGQSIDFLDGRDRQPLDFGEERGGVLVREDPFHLAQG
jgi:hypothetical protein